MMRILFVVEILLGRVTSFVRSCSLSELEKRNTEEEVEGGGGLPKVREGYDAMGVWLTT
jgi:hypothetical protein